MRSLFKLSLAAVVACLFAVSAIAQDMPKPAPINLQSVSAYTPEAVEALKPSVKLGFAVTNIFGIWSSSSSTKRSDDTDSDKTDTAFSNYRNEYQLDWSLVGTSGPVTARALIRFRDLANHAAAANPPGDGAASPSERVPETNRADIYWKVTDQFQLGLMARSLGLPFSSNAYGVYNSSACSSGCSIGEVVGPVGFFSNVRGLDFRYSLNKDMYLGLALLDDCVPACGYNPSATVLSTANKNESSMVPYFNGTFGPATVGFYMSNAAGVVAVAKTTPAGAVADNTVSSTVKDDDKAVTASVMDLNVAVNLGVARIGFEWWNQTQTCDKDAAGVSKCDDGTSTSTVLGVKAAAGPGQVEFHYSTVSTGSGNTTIAVAPAIATKTEVTASVTDLMLGYAIAINQTFTIVPLYASRTTSSESKGSGPADSNKTTVDLTQTFLALGARAAF